VSGAITERRVGPPLTANSQRERILVRLREVGSRGVLAAEFYDDQQCRYGRSPRNRISELRAMGHKITGEWESKVNFRYTLIKETPAPKALPDYSAQKKLDWYERQTGQSRPNTAGANLGPLFEVEGAGS
jgi:Helix-turn-helix domain